jgi:purine-binding chemotaxis protein CheW
MNIQSGTREQFAEYVTVMIGDQLFGLPIGRVQDVFVPEKLTRVPLAPPEVAGVLNLRGRIVTAIDMRRKLDLPPRAEDQPVMAVGIDTRGESYGLLVDSIGEVLKFPNSACEPKPANLDERWARVASDLIRLEGQLLVVLDVDRVLDVRQRAIAA